jgi:hypothetical protein
MTTKLFLIGITYVFTACKSATKEKKQREVIYEKTSSEKVNKLEKPHPNSGAAEEADYIELINFEEAAGTIPFIIPEYSTERENSALPILITAEDKDCIPFPSTIAELNSGTDMFLYKLNRALGGYVKSMGYGVDLGKKDILFVQDYVRYTDCNETKRVGIGLRCFIHVKDIHGRASFNKLSQVAASVEVGKATASFSLKSLGFAIDGSVLVEGLQNQGEYNSEAAGKLTQVYNNVLKMLNANNTMTIKPVILPKE